MVRIQVVESTIPDRFPTNPGCYSNNQGCFDAVSYDWVRLYPHVFMKGLEVTPGQGPILEGISQGGRGGVYLNGILQKGSKITDLFPNIL